MAKAQFNVRLDPALAAKLRREAQRRQQTPGILVAEAIELLLSGNSPAPGPAPQGLAEALAALQQRVAKLERSAPAQAPPPPAQLPIELPAGAITTAELAERTGTNRAAWNNWANKAAPGQVRHHPEAGSWRLVGKGAGPNGGPERWRGEPARAHLQQVADQIREGSPLHIGLELELLMQVPRQRGAHPLRFAAH